MDEPVTITISYNPDGSKNIHHNASEQHLIESAASLFASALKMVTDKGCGCPSCQHYMALSQSMLDAMGVDRERLNYAMKNAGEKHRQ